MKELDFLKIINESLSDSSYLGDDCAFLDDFGLFVTHDTLVEDVHFSMYTTSSYLLGRKSISVNLSDLAAALAVPLYVTVSLSVPKTVSDSFVKDLYKGINDVCREYNVKVIGGDLTGSDKIVISVCAIGKKSSSYMSSRRFARNNDYILVTGEFGSSGAGLYALSNFLQADQKLINSHLNPVPKIKEMNALSKIIKSDIASMDTSDGLIDALYKISLASKHSVKIDINKVPVNSELIEFCCQNNLDFKKFVKWGAEDYEQIICVPEDIYLALDKNIFTCIGRVMNKDLNPCVIIQDENFSETVNYQSFSQNSYSHF